MRQMGGLRKKMPITFLAFLASTIAISGVPPFAGFWSKDAILGAALAFGMENPAHYAPFVMALIAALITAFYMFRMVFLTFMGQPRNQEKYDHAHEVGWRMAAPLVILGTLAVVGGGVGTLGSGSWFDRFVQDPGKAQIEHVEHVEHAAGFELVETAHAADPHEVDAHAEAVHGGGHDVHHVAHQRAMILSLIVASLGILLSWLTYMRKRISSAGVLAALPDVHRWLAGKYFVDEFYHSAIVQNLLRAARLAAGFDRTVIDGIVNGTAYLSRAVSVVSGGADKWVVDGLVNSVAILLQNIGGFVGTWQTGRVQNYFLGLVSGLIVLILLVRAGWLS